jgi:hypothetical protein
MAVVNADEASSWQALSSVTKLKFLIRPGMALWGIHGGTK